MRLKAGSFNPPATKAGPSGVALNRSRSAPPLVSVLSYLRRTIPHANAKGAGDQPDSVSSSVFVATPNMCPGPDGSSCNFAERVVFGPPQRTCPSARTVASFGLLAFLGEPFSVNNRKVCSPKGQCWLKEEPIIPEEKKRALKLNTRLSWWLPCVASWLLATRTTLLVGANDWMCVCVLAKKWRVLGVHQVWSTFRKDPKKDKRVTSFERQMRVMWSRFDLSSFGFFPLFCCY